MENTPTPPQTTDKQLLSTPAAILLSGVLIAGALLYALLYAPGKGTTQTGDAGEGAVKTMEVSASDHALGDPKTAELTLIEFSDLECPYCSQFHPVMEKIKNEYGSKVAWVYRHFPLSQIHPEAFPAAVASECVASAQGNDAFWRFIDGIFINQARIGTALYRELAGKEGISASALDACIAEASTTSLIESQFSQAVAAGGQGTPFTVIVDKKGKILDTLPGALQYAQAKAKIDALLAK